MKYAVVRNCDEQNLVDDNCHHNHDHDVDNRQRKRKSEENQEIHDNNALLSFLSFLLGFDEHLCDIFCSPM